MAPKRAIVQRRAASAQGHETQAQIRAAQTEENSLATASAEERAAQLESSLETAQVHLLDAQVHLLDAQAQIDALEECVTIKTQENSGLKTENAKLLGKISNLQSQIVALSARKEGMTGDLRITRQKLTRQSAKNAALCATIAELEESADAQQEQLKALKSKHKDVLSCLNNLETERQKLSKTLTKVQNSGEIEQKNNKEGLALLRSKLVDSQRQTSLLKKKTQRASGVLERSVAHVEKKTFTKATTFYLMEKGVFKESVRALVRYLFKIGVPAYRMDEVIQKVCSLVGIKIAGTISRTSVARIIQEGEVSAKLQIGYELSEAKGFTLSADGTGHRAINYNSRHINLKAEDYTTGKISHKTRFLGIKASLDGSSAESIKDYDLVLGNICDLFNQSPFGKRQRNKNPLRLVEVFTKLTGMHTDHCAKEKKDAEAMEKKKKQAVCQVLGEKQLMEQDTEELLPHFTAARNKMITKLGGEEAWKSLSEAKQAEQNAEMVQGIVQKLGEGSLELMSESEQRILNLFIWAGCGCHKELNTVRGGYSSMVQWYQEHETETQPILLANRDNAPVLKDITTEGDIENDIQAHAFEMTGRGGIKCAQIAGAIFNNKLDKKGHHDAFRWWWEKEVQCAFTFPDTSNTRFGSYCDAAIALIVNLDNFKRFLQYVKSKKDNNRWTHMEENLWNALHDPPTLCELVILGLYGEVVGTPYMARIRQCAQEKVNMLDLGSLHKQVYEHMKSLSRNPEDLLAGNPDESHLTSVLFGNAWKNPAFIKTVYSMAPNLPNIDSLLHAFFTGASATWERFTSEFAPGGLIDEASQEEKELAWLMPTNDVNEGALGSFRVMMRHQPQLSLTGYNAQAMYFRNDTQAFVQKHFVEPEDLKFVHAVARENSGEDRKRRKEIVEFTQKRAKEKEDRRKERQKKAEDKQSHLDQLELVLDTSAIGNLKGPALRNMFNKFKQANAPALDKVQKGHNGKVADIQAALVNAVDCYNEKTWVPTLDSMAEDNEEVIPIDDESSDWESDNNMD